MPSAQNDEVEPLARNRDFKVLLGSQGISALRTNLSPDALLGRIGSTARTLTLGLSLIGLLVGGLLIDATSGSTTIALMGVALIAASAVFALVPAMRRASGRFVPG